MRCKDVLTADLCVCYVWPAVFVFSFRKGIFHCHGWQSLWKMHREISGPRGSTFTTQSLTKSLHVLSEDRAGISRDIQQRKGSPPPPPPSFGNLPRTSTSTNVKSAQLIVDTQDLVYIYVVLVGLINFVQQKHLTWPLLGQLEVWYQLKVRLSLSWSIQAIRYQTPEGRLYPQITRETAQSEHIVGACHRPRHHY